MTIKDLRQKRLAAEIPATMLASRAKVNRSKLSLLECGHALPTPDELDRLGVALDELIGVRDEVQKTAAALGWPCVA
jgi:hypothetical protein